MEKLSNNIRELRFKYGEITQWELGARVGISRQTMNAIENGRHAPTVAVAIRIADLFQVSVDQLFQLENDGKPSCRAPTVNINPGPLQPTIEEPIDMSGSREQVDEIANRQPTLADLRNMI